LDYRGINCTVGRYLLYKSVTKRRGLYKYQSRLTEQKNCKGSAAKEKKSWKKD
jgi:hypothetical protein